MTLLPSEQLRDDAPLLNDQVEKYWQAYQQACVEHDIATPEHNDFVNSLVRVWASSEFVAETCIRHPDLILALFASGDILREYPEGEYAQRMRDGLQDCADEAALMRNLRQLRRREMVRIAWRNLANWVGLRRTISDLSDFADACINATNSVLYAWQTEQYGTPLTRQKKPMKFIVIALGKLGSQELNFSSDIDLIFAYAKEGVIDGSDMSHEEFFKRLGQRLVKTLSAITADGFVFRVDTRLRPYGDSGPLVNSFANLHDYYANHGRDWERYALIKSRVVGHDAGPHKRLLVIVRNFVYRRYVDYTMIESMRQLQQVISLEVRKKGLEENVKRGPGGIREVEFIGQTYKLINGGWFARLQERNTLRTLNVLREMDYLSEDGVDALMCAYKFLRDVENRLQMFSDKQTQTLPADEYGRASLVHAMQLSDWPAFMQQLHQHMTYVHHTFETLIAKPNMQFSDPEAERLKQSLSQIWLNKLQTDSAVELLDNHNVKEPREILRLLSTLRDSNPCVALSTRERQRLDDIMPHLLVSALRQANSDVAISRMLSVVEALLRETTHLALLNENPIAITQLIKLCEASQWIAEQIARFPNLLNELINPKTLYAPPALDELRQELQHALAGIPEDDVETLMNVLRSFKQAHMLRVAAADITDELPLMKVSDYLTWIATVVLETVLKISADEMVRRYGYPNPDNNSIDFMILGYGKLGGIELGYGSDLDLVFLHADVDEDQLSSGVEPINQPLFYMRLGQQIANLLTAPSEYGRLYEVDLRLRPSGASGLLVSSMTAYQEYQQHQAWLWEHQALVRARYIAGSEMLAKHFEQIRSDVLSVTRDEQELRQGVHDMREKMRTAANPVFPGKFDLRQGKGAITDIEFLAQYAVLRWAHEHASLLDWTDNIRILENLGVEGLFNVDDVRLLSDAYRVYRATMYRLRLQTAPAEVDDAEFMEFRPQVEAIYQKYLGYS
tara:strand:+ start:8731 stop:11622 length:2892 start_codon:yes stop_codon:yes gene_type:complete